MPAKTECSSLKGPKSLERFYCVDESILGLTWQPGPGGRGVRPGVPRESVNECKKGLDSCPYRKWKRTNRYGEFFESVDE